MTETTLPRLLTVPEAAEALNVKPATLQARWKIWGLRPVKIGGTLRFSEQDILTYIESRYVA